MATKFKVQRAIEVHGNLQEAVRIGRVWETVVKPKRRAVAERLAQLNRIDARHERPIVTRVAPVRIA